MKAIQKRIWWAVFYVIAVLPFLPMNWFYFDKNESGVDTGIDVFFNLPGVIFFSITFIVILCSLLHIVIAMLSVILIWIQVVVYIYQFCYWYEAFITDFRLDLSLDVAHTGFYLAFVAIFIYAVIYSIRFRKYLLHNIF